MIAALLTLALTTDAGVPTTVAVDLAGVDEATQRELRTVELERYLVLRLVQDGFAVVPLGASPIVTVRLQVADGQVTLTARSAAGEAVRTVPSRGTPVAELHLELAQRVTELVRRAEAAAPPPQPRQPVVSATPAPASVERGPPRRSLVVSVSALWHGSADAAISADLRTALTPAVKLVVTAGFSPSRGAGLSVYESQLLAGFALVLFRDERFDLQLGLEIGVLLHAFATDADNVTDPRGLRFDAVGAVPLAVSWHFSEPWTIGALLAPAATLHAREHRQDGQTQWQRTALGLQAGVRVGVGF